LYSTLEAEETNNAETPMCNVYTLRKQPQQKPVISSQKTRIILDNLLQSSTTKGEAGGRRGRTRRK
jgi:hypothetical protein